MPSRSDHLKALSRSIGVINTLNILLRRLVGAKNHITVKFLSNRIIVRPCDSDLFVLGQVFGSKEYGLAEDMEKKINDIAKDYKSQGNRPLIVDAGANVGYSAIYFAETYPDADIIAIEPDLQTFSIMKQNCRGYDQILPLHAALWKHNCGVNLQNLNDSSWARMVADQGTTKSCTLDEIVSIFSNAKPLILKMDIEGAEKESIEAAPDTLRRFHVIMIEPHDFMAPGRACLAPLYSAISSQKYDTLISGENLILVSV